MENYHVVIKSYDDKEYKDTITGKPTSLRGAERIEEGVNINLNHKLYYTELESVEG